MIARAGLALAALVPATALGCELPVGAPPLETPRYRLALITTPSDIRPGQFFAVTVAVCPKDRAPAPETVRMDAHMPDHRHGMNYAPRVAAAGEGAWRGEGFLFHMPGRWEFVIELRAEGRSERATLVRRVP